MKVILLQSVKSLGAKGTVHEVSDGYFRNFLQPQKWAKVAEASALAAIAQREEQQHKKEEARSAALREAVNKIGKLAITMSREADAKGTLYAALSLKDIVAKLKEYKCEVEEAHVHVSEHIKHTGDYTVRVSPEVGIEASFKLKVVKKL